MPEATVIRQKHLPKPKPAKSQQLAKIQPSPPAVQDDNGSLLAVIARAAADPSVDVDKMERLLQMQERVLKSQARMAFDSDFSLMQTKMPLITENGEIKFTDAKGVKHNTKYALFEDINQAIKPVMQEFGFSISFKVQNQDSNKINVTGILMHRMGHREETTMTLPADTTGSKNTVQSLGSSVSYAKRYVLMAMLNITTKGEDTDAVVFINEDQLLTLDTLLKDTKADRIKFLAYMNISELAKLPAEQYDNAVAAIQKAEKDRAAAAAKKGGQK